jgi:hypothetical protein
VNFYNKSAVLTLAVSALAAPAFCTNLMPNFSTVPTGWTVDRYAPAQFASVGPQFGQPDVLQIGIDASGGYNSRPAPYQSTFYNTQGEQYQVSGGAGDSISALLYVSSAWADPSNGNVRTDIWADTTAPGNGQGDFAVLGFTNYGGPARFRGWDSGLGQWNDLADPILYDQWNLLDMEYDGTSIQYFVNGQLSLTLTDLSFPNTNIQTVWAQAYNFNGADPALSGAVASNYSVLWASSVPEPSSIVLFGAGLAAVVARLRKKRNA